MCSRDPIITTRKKTMFYFNPTGSSSVSVNVELVNKPSNMLERVFLTFPIDTWT